MTANGWMQIALFAVAVLLVTKPMGLYLTAVFTGRLGERVHAFARVERAIYRLLGIREQDQQHWTQYAAGLLVFSLCGVLVTYVGLRLQAVLPLNPAGLPAVPARQAFETAVSFVTNTNWQSYAGEGTMSHLSQMLWLTVQNFASAAVGLAVAVALSRGIAHRGSSSASGSTFGSGRVGNIWVDVTRATLYVLLPLSLLWSLLFVQQGVPQTLRGPVVVSTLEGASQTIALGPVASQEAIKQIGTNGGGFFNANAAHPFENPSPWSNWLSMFAIFLIPAGTVWMFGEMVGSRRHGWAIWSAMFALFLVGTSVAYWAEARGNPLHAARGVDVAGVVPGHSGGNMEGKEVRFGIANSALYAVVTTDASCGAVNAMHDSFTALGGLVTLVNMQLGELIFGGVGAGLYGVLIMVVLTVFIAGLMVGRTPEYLGKRIQQREIQMAMLYILAFPAIVLILAAVSLVLPNGLAGLNNRGPHGLTEVLYAFTSTAANNGSAFAGLTGATTYYNLLFGVAMLLGRFALIVPVLALAGFFAERAPAPATSGTFPVTGPLFTLLLLGVILIVGALTFFPAMALGPVVEHFLTLAGRVVA